MPGWFFAKITDYWDWQAQAIAKNSARLNLLAAPECKAALAEIEGAIREHLRALSDDLLLKVTVTLVDDLYKTGNQLEMWTAGHREYLAHTAAVVLSALQERRYSVRYLIDNRFDGMDRVFKVFPVMFAAAGLKYISPANMALQIMTLEGKHPESFAAEWLQYTAEARYVADLAAEKLNAAGASYVYLNTEDCERPFEVCARSEGRVLFVTREDAPVAGSRVAVRFPYVPVHSAS